MKSFKFLLLMMVISLLFITACGNTVNENNTLSDDYSDYTGQILLKDEPEYSLYAIPTNNALQQSVICTITDLDNLVFNNNLNIYVPDSISRVLVRISGNFDKEYGNELLRKLIGEAEWNDKYYISAENRGPYYPYGPEYNGVLSDGQQIYACIWCTGSCCFIKGNGRDGLSGHYLAELNYLGMDQNEIYSFPGANISLKEAISIGNSFFEEFYSSTDVEVSFRPSYIRLTGSEEQIDFICIVYQVVYRNTAITDVQDHHDGSESYTTGHIEAFMGPYLILDPTGNVVYFGSGAGTLETYEDYGFYEKLIPLDTAIQLLSNALSGYTDYTIDNIDLEYRTVYMGTDQPEETYRNGIPDLKGTATIYASYEVFELQPYWVFYTNHMEEYKQVMFFVNAITGEVKVIDNAD